MVGEGARTSWLGSLGFCHSSLSLLYGSPGANPVSSSSSTWVAFTYPSRCKTFGVPTSWFMGLCSPFQASEARPRDAARATTPRIAADARGAATAEPKVRSWRSMCVTSPLARAKSETALPS